MPEAVEEHFELWWDAKLAWQVFMDISSPWKFTMGEVAGIDDAAIIAVMALHPIKRIDRLEVFRDVQAAANGALKQLREQAEKRQKKP